MIEIVDALIELIFAHVRGGVRDRMGITGLHDHVGDGNIFPNTDSAVREYRRRFPGTEVA